MAVLRILWGDRALKCLMVTSSAKDTLHKLYIFLLLNVTFYHLFSLT